MPVDLLYLGRYLGHLSPHLGNRLVYRLLGKVAWQAHLVDVLYRQELVDLLEVPAIEHYESGG